MTENNYDKETPDPNDDGNFEIRLRLLANEVFAISITADPLSSQWVSWAVLIAFLTVFGLSLFGEPLTDFYRSLTEAQQSSQNK